MSQDMKRQPDGRLLCHHYLFHHLAQEDISSFLEWMDRESADSLLQLFRFSQESSQIQLITCIDSHHRAVALLTVFPAFLTQLKSSYKLTAGEYSLAHLHLHAAQTWEVSDLAHLLTCYMKHLVNAFQRDTFYWEIHREDHLFRAAAEQAGFTNLFKEERLFVLYAYAG